MKAKVNIFPLLLNYMWKLPYTILRALSHSVDYVYLRTKRRIVNGVVKLPHGARVSVSEQAAPLIWPVTYAENSWKNLGRHVVKLHSLGTCDGGRILYKIWGVVITILFWSEVCLGVILCHWVNFHRFEGKSAFAFKVWGVVQSSPTSQTPQNALRKSSNHLSTLTHWQCHISADFRSVHLFYIFARVNAYLYLEMPCKLISCMLLCHMPYIQI